VQDPLKYAVVERERRFIVAELPDGVVAVTQIVDHYLYESRLRLREMIDADGSVVRKLGQKVRLSPGPDEIACTSICLNDTEWEQLRQLPARTLHKTRHIVERDGLRIAVDELADGTLLAEIDDGDSPTQAIPDWLKVLAEVTAEENWTGASLAR
jgi:CYTH domain-containing protein